ncbi:MAG: NAD(P)-dependent glycerol-3-phosphate dehydrogenase [Bradyrhizobium sp.]|nr:MAG: NAD(P)-dependent glycerol-3-phosphate dehydrogenase [Bradyrhizobium sp.]
MVSTQEAGLRRGQLTEFATIGVAGAGAWGLALANAAAAAGRKVVVWDNDPEALRALAQTRLSARLPGVALAQSVVVGKDVGALASCDAALLVVPAQATRNAAAHLSDAMGPRPLIACAKGIERGSQKFMTEVVAESAPRWPAAMLSGPSFASDVAAGLPTALTLASTDEPLARALCEALRGPNLRLYHSTDVRGVEIGGAAKNVLAIACGVASGLGLGASAGAALIARGFAELRRFAAAYGARPATLMGLSGLGDLVLTCSTSQSRNFSFGAALGRGARVADAGAGALVEGALTAATLVQMARAKEVDMPIAAMVDALLTGTVDVAGAVGALLSRPLKGEE